MWDIYLTSPAKKHLSKIPKEMASRLATVLEEMRNNPLNGDLTKIATDIWRRRIGNYRVVFQILPKEKIIFILGILRRTSATY